MATGQYIGVNGVARKVVSPYVGVEGVARNVKNGYVGVEGVARLFFAPDSGTKTVLQVAKQTLDTYTSETEYTGESFVAISVYPKTNGTVKVTYGGLTKTITDTSGVEKPNAQTVYFGTLYGVTDSVATPASGELTIEGQFQEFGCGVYYMKGKFGQANSYCACITAVSEWGDITAIPGNAFNNCTSLALTSLPSGVTSIGDYAFQNCTGLALTSLPSGVTSIGSHAFNSCTNIALTSLPNALTSIGVYAFYQCSHITSIVIPASVVSIGSQGIAFSSNSSDWAIYTAYRFLGTTPPDIGAGSGSYDAFGPTTYEVKGGIIVPKGCAAVYKATAGFSGSKRVNCIVEAS